MNVVLSLITGVIVGAMLGYYFAMDSFIRFATKTGAGLLNDPAVRNAVRAIKGKPQEARFYPSMTDEEVDKEDGELQATLRSKIHPSAKQMEDEA